MENKKIILRIISIVFGIGTYVAFKLSNISEAGSFLDLFSGVLFIVTNVMCIVFQGSPTIKKAFGSPIRWAKIMWDKAIIISEQLVLGFIGIMIGLFFFSVELVFPIYWSVYALVKEIKERDSVE